MFIALLLIINPSVAIANVFIDIDNHWAKREITRLSGQNVINGYKGLFNPSGTVTRAQFAKMVVNGIGLGKQANLVSNTQSPFTDVHANHWGNGYITVAYENGIIGGYEDGTFKPDAKITRVEIAAILVRALKELDYSKTSSGNNLNFQDSGTTPAWAEGIIKQAVSKGLIGGYEDGTFRPMLNATRAEASVLICRLLKQLGRQHDYIGTIVEVNSQQKKLVLNIQGQHQIFWLANDAILFHGNNLIEINQVSINAFTGVIVDSEGYINLLEIDPSLKIAQNLFRFSDQESKVNGAKLSGDESVIFGQSLLSETRPTITSVNGQRLPPSPGDSLSLTRKLISAPGLGATGKGQLIAIIDTGIDPAHPDLRTTIHGDAKIFDWVDFTKEGKLDMNNIVEIKSGRVEIDGVEYRLSPKISASNYLRYGYWEEASITTPNGKGLDLNFNGTKDDKILILLADSTTPWKYDTVYVKTQPGEDFAQEQPLLRYVIKRSIGKFEGKEPDQTFGFVVTDIHPEGYNITLGFDGNGHGTHVAGIAAANGKVIGMAPGAQVIAIKAIGSGGSSSWETIAQAINYAAARGAKVINLSLGLPSAHGDGASSPNRLLENIRDQYGVHFIVAAGNNGPGLSTVSTPADTDGIISVGAYISPEMWSLDYGWKVPKDTLWFFSSLGPRFDGGFTPQIVAPGSALSTMAGGGYSLAEGTSMAAPHVAGGVALLLDKALQDKIEVNPEKMRQALTMAAKSMVSFTEVEQGYGKFSVLDTWEHLKKVSNQPIVKSQVFHYSMIRGSGLYAREFVPGQLNFKINNMSNKDVTMDLSQSEDWLSPLQPKVLLPKLRSRDISVRYSPPKEVGLYVGRITGTIKGQSGRTLEILNTFINPYTFSNDRKTIGIEDEALPAQYKRYFFQVPPNTDFLDINLAIGEENGKLNGRTRLHVYNPKGKEVDQNLYEFAGIGPNTTKTSVSRTIKKPMSGTWEVVAYTSATLSDFNLDKSVYRLTVSIDSVHPPKLNEISDKILVGMNLGLSPDGVFEYVTFVVRNRKDLQLYEGIIVINGRAFSVVSGKVTIKVPQEWRSFPWKIDTTY